MQTYVRGSFPWFRWQMELLSIVDMELACSYPEISLATFFYVERHYEAVKARGCEV